MTVNLYKQGYEMVSDQAYYATNEEFIEGFRRAMELIKSLPMSEYFYSTIVRGEFPGLLAASETGDLRFSTQSKDYLTGLERWKSFEIPEEIYRNIKSTSIPSTPEDTPTQELTDKSPEPKQTRVKYRKKERVIPARTLDQNSRRNILRLFYRSLEDEDRNISTIPAYFQPEICYQLFMSLTANGTLPKDQDEYRILDPTSGWGDRMIGFALLSAITGKKIYYHANDLNSELEEPYRRLISRIKNIPKLTQNFFPSYTISNAQELTLDQIGWNAVDLIFTSPPYYDMEDTIRDGDYETYEDWAEQWFIPFIEHIRSLDEYAVVVLHLANTKRASLVDTAGESSVRFTKLLPPRGIGWDMDYKTRPVLIISPPVMTIHTWNDAENELNESFE